MTRSDPSDNGLINSIEWIWMRWWQDKDGLHNTALCSWVR